MSTQKHVIYTQHQQLISKLKGYKHSVKEFRRNILLKSKQASKIQKPISSTGITTKNQSITRSRAESSLVGSKSYHPIQTQSSFTLERQHKSIERQNTQKKIYQFFKRNELQNKRMEEYLSVVYKKAEDDADKLIKIFEKKTIEKSNEKKFNNKNLHTNFMKRLKMQTAKLRAKIQKSELQLRNKSKSGLLINVQNLMSKNKNQKIFPSSNTNKKIIFFKRNKSLE